MTPQHWLFFLYLIIYGSIVNYATFVWEPKRGRNMHHYQVGFFFLLNSLITYFIFLLNPGDDLYEFILIASLLGGIGLIGLDSRDFIKELKKILRKQSSQ